MWNPKPFMIVKQSPVVSQEERQRGIESQQIMAKLEKKGENGKGKAKMKKVLSRLHADRWG